MGLANMVDAVLGACPRQDQLVRFKHNLPRLRAEAGRDSGARNLSSPDAPAWLCSVFLSLPVGCCP